MIIKSMSRKQPSFAQLIDYIEGEAKLKSRAYSIHHNIYSHDTEELKREFAENAEHLHQRKNGVYLYHEVVSIARSHTIHEDEQKARLKHITEEYIRARAKHNMAYAVLHEDTGNLHFHIVLSANAVGDARRLRLSKEQFAEIQTRHEAWVLSAYPELEQQAVFKKNKSQRDKGIGIDGHQEQASTQDHANSTIKSHLSDKGEQMKRRGAKTDKRDAVQERLAEIFATAMNPEDLTKLMQQAGFTLYTRGKTHGVTDRDGTKYRLAKLGLSDTWKALDERMTAHLKATAESLKTKTQEVWNEAKEKVQAMAGQGTTKEANQEGDSQSLKDLFKQVDEANKSSRQAQSTTPQDQHQSEQQNEYEDEVTKRLKSMQDLRADRAKKEASDQARNTSRGQDRER